MRVMLIVRYMHVMCVCVLCLLFLLLEDRDQGGTGRMCACVCLSLCMSCGTSWWLCCSLATYLHLHTPRRPFGIFYMKMKKNARTT